MLVGRSHVPCADWRRRPSDTFELSRLARSPFASVFAHYPSNRDTYIISWKTSAESTLIGNPTYYAFGLFRRAVAVRKTMNRRESRRVPFKCRNRRVDQQCDRRCSFLRTSKWTFLYFLIRFVAARKVAAQTRRGTLGLVKRWIKHVFNVTAERIEMSMMVTIDLSLSTQNRFGSRKLRDCAWSLAWPLLFFAFD